MEEAPENGKESSHSAHGMNKSHRSSRRKYTSLGPERTIMII